MSISSPRPELGLVSGVTLTASDILDVKDAPDLMPPHGIFMVKGWSRSVAAIAIMACAWTTPSFREARLNAECVSSAANQSKSFQEWPVDLQKPCVGNHDTSFRCVGRKFDLLGCVFFFARFDILLE